MRLSSKLVNKGTCWENKSSSLVTSMGLQGDLTKGHLLGNCICFSDEKRVSMCIFKMVAIAFILWENPLKPQHMHITHLHSSRDLNTHTNTQTDTHRVYQHF